MRNDYIRRYLSDRDWRKKENANVNESFSNLQSFIASKILANDFLRAVGRKARYAHVHARIHIHNLESGGYIPYSYNGDMPIIVRRKGNILIIRIRDAEVGDEVLDKAGAKWTRITNKIVHKSHCDMLRITLDDGSLLEVTEDHPVIMHYRETVKMARELKIGDTLQGSHLSQRDFHFGRLRLSSKLAWILGLYIAEGNPTNSAYQISIKDRKIKCKLYRYLEELGLHYWDHVSHHKTSIFLYKKHYMLEPLGKVDKYAENKNIPYYPFSLQTYFDIISGIIDGDGTRQDDYATEIVIASKSYTLLQQIKIVFEKVRIPCSLRYSDNIYKLRFYITEETEPLFRESVKISSKPVKYYKGANNLNYYSPAPRVVKIERIEWKGRDVYDITTETGTFTSVGLKLHNCSGHNLRVLLLNGMKTPTVYSAPAKHLSSAVDQMMNWIYMSQLEFAGAQAFNDVDTLLAPFIRHDRLSYRQVKQEMQKLVYNLNYTMRSSGQSPFSNFSLNFGVPKYLESEPVVIGGRVEENGTYADYVDEALMIDRAIIEIMTEGDPNNKPFTFPILTVNLTKRFPWDSEEAVLMAKNAAVRGSFYWMNYIGSGIDEDTVRAMCCRLNLNLKELSGPRGLWNTGEGTGSLGVVTINFPRLAYETRGRDEDIFFERLEELMDLALYILNFRKQRIQKYMKRLMPFSMMNGWTMRTYFLTIGVIGLNEMCLNMFDEPIMEHIDFVVKVLEYMRQYAVRKQKEMKQLINIEMIPGEGSSYRLALIDRKECPGIRTMGSKKAPYYSTLLIPPAYEVPLYERIELEEKVLPLFTGGTIFRIFLGEREPEATSLLRFIQKVAQTRIPYFDVTCTYSVCLSEGTIHRGVHYKCPVCNGETEIYSRIVGYYRPLKKWNVGKKREFKDRRYINF
ncbi:MAG: anaerobic ribonucleoside-triphosphate reductase [Thermoprotei archaeon]|nr:MAG: anaerobic ribonucleoside-triphosphate reductase [Thermoprotei archaeon]